MKLYKKTSITTEKAIGRFIRNLEFKNCTDNTINWYKGILEMWARYMEAQNKVSVRNITKDDIMDYIIHLKTDRQNNATSQNNKLRALRAFFNWCLENNYLEINPVTNLKIKEVKKYPETFKIEDLKKLLRQPARHTFAGYRDYVIMVLLMDSAIRISECLDLEIEDLVFEGSGIHAMFLQDTKSREVQRVSLTSLAGDVLVEWLEHLEGKKYKGKWVFPAMHGQGRVSTRTIQQRISDYGRRIGLQKCSPHMFRHTFGKCFTETGGNTRALQEHLRHSSISVTQIYSQISSSNMRKIVEKHSPSSLLISAGWTPD